MSLQVKIDARQKVVIVKLAGEIGDADILQIGPATKSDPLFDPSFSELVDFSGVTGGKVSSFAVQMLARRTSIYDRASKHAVVAAQPQVFGLSRMFQVYAQETRPGVLVVQTLDEACEFLGIQKSEV